MVISNHLDAAGEAPSSGLPFLHGISGTPDSDLTPLSA
jgi:hypothetical protein